MIQEAEQVFDENRTFFVEFLNDFETASEIPSDVRGNIDGEVKFFEQKISDDIDDFCKENRLTPAALCLAVLSYVVARYTMNCKVYLTTISSGRGNVKFSDTFGMFVNTLTLIAELENISVAELPGKISTMFAADYSDALIAGFAKSFNIVMEKFIADKNSPLLKVSLIDDDAKKFC